MVARLPLEQEIEVRSLALSAVMHCLMVQLAWTPGSGPGD